MAPGTRRRRSIGKRYYAVAFVLGDVWFLGLWLLYLNGRADLDVRRIWKLIGPGGWFSWALFGATGALTARILAPWILKPVGVLEAIYRGASLHLLGAALCASLLLLASVAVRLLEIGIEVSDFVTFAIGIVFLFPVVSLVISIPTLPMGLPLGLLAAWLLGRVAGTTRSGRPVGDRSS